MSTTNILDLNNRIDKLDALTDEIGLKINYFDVTVPTTSTNYNYSNDKPSDFSLPLAAFSVQGGGAVITQIALTIIYFESALVNQSTIRILYVAT